MKSVKLATNVSPRSAEIIKALANDKQVSVSKWIEWQLEKVVEAHMLNTYAKPKTSREILQMFEDYRQLFKNLADK